MTNQTWLPGLNKSSTCHSFEIAFYCQAAARHEFVLTASSTSAQILFGFLVLQKELFGKSGGMNHSAQFFFCFFLIIVQKDPAPTHVATMLLFSFMSDVITSHISVREPNLL